VLSCNRHGMGWHTPQLLTPTRRVFSQGRSRPRAAPAHSLEALDAKCFSGGATLNSHAPQVGNSRTQNRCTSTTHPSVSRYTREHIPRSCHTLPCGNCGISFVVISIPISR
jgi:hypothetical protein